MYPFSKNISRSLRIRASMPPPQKKKTQSAINDIWMHHLHQFSERPPLFLEIPSRTLTAKIRLPLPSPPAYGSGPTCSFWIRDWQCSVYYYGYGLIYTPEGTILLLFFKIVGGGGGASPHQWEERPFPYPPHSGPHPYLLWVYFWTRHWKLAVLLIQQ